jgi:hypothetical protein
MIDEAVKGGAGEAAKLEVDALDRALAKVLDHARAPKEFRSRFMIVFLSPFRRMTNSMFLK